MAWTIFLIILLLLKAELLLLLKTINELIFLLLDILLLKQFQNLGIYFSGQRILLINLPSSLKHT